MPLYGTWHNYGVRMQGNNDDQFVTTYDDDFDSTYGTYEFRVPEKRKMDFDKIMEGDFKSVSAEYQKYLREFYPKLNGLFDKVFAIAPTAEEGNT